MSSTKQSIRDENWIEFLSFVKFYNDEAMKRYKEIDSSNPDNYRDIEFGPGSISADSATFDWWYLEYKVKPVCPTCHQEVKHNGN